MKNKFGLWFNIVTICLCVCAIAIGVYSATTANLNASGKLGFTAHGCDVDVSGTIVGHAAGNTADGLPVTAPESLGATVEVRSDTKTLDLGSRYFTDMASTDGSAEDIVVTLTVTNKSKFDITAEITGTTVAENTAISITATPESQIIAQNESATVTITLTLTSTASNIAMPSADNVSIDMEFNKFVEEEFPFYVISEANTDEKFNYYGYLATTMGHAVEECDRTTSDLEWIAFAVRGTGTEETGFTTKPDFISTHEAENLEDGEQVYSLSITGATPAETWYSLNGVDMTNVDYSGYTFWFIQRYTTIGYYSFNDDWTEYAEGTPFNHSADLMNNYQGSDMQQLLSETSMYISMTGIADSYVYDRAKARTVNETDAGLSYGSGSQVTTFTSKLWLLNQKELGLLNGDETIYDNTYSEPVKAYGIGNATGDADGNGAFWWLRSPDQNIAHYVHYVYHGGYLGSTSVDGNGGFRAAFQITI
ncbi:MAG: hypothetical protein IJ318_00765 [Clostridia bacterium]|nr:hypothetical protein [Clostridia bacterium]